MDGNKNSNNKNENSETVFKFFETYIFRVFLNILCRILCLTHAICLILFIIHYEFVKIGFLFFLPVLSLFAMVIEGFVVIIRHGGKQSKWFSLCMYLYLMSVIPYFWILAVKFGNKSTNEIEKKRLLNWPKYLQQAFYILIIFLRVLLPKYNSSREQASNVVKFLINIVSDAQELQSNVSEFREENIEKAKVENYELLIYFYLFTWTWSLTLFCLNVDETLEDDDENEEKTNLDSKEIIIKKRLDYIDSLMMFRLFRNFYWKFFFVLLLIDLPYLTIRIAGTFYFGKSLPGGYFFAGKNGCQVLLGIHRVICRVWASNMSKYKAKNEVVKGLKEINNQEKNDDNEATKNKK